MEERKCNAESATETCGPSVSGEPRGTVHEVVVRRSQPVHKVSRDGCFVGGVGGLPGDQGKVHVVVKHLHTHGGSGGTGNRGNSI